MPYYKCTFLTENGRRQKREIFAKDRRAIRDICRDSDDKILSIRRMWLHGTSLLHIFRRKIPYTDFFLFNQELIILLKAGVPFIHGVETILLNVRNIRLREVLTRAGSDIRNGMQISEAFHDADLPFQKIYQSSLMAGERSGKLEEVLAKFNEYLDKVNILRKKIVSSMMYPLVLLVFMAAMMMVVMLYVLPKFSGFFEEFDASLPGITLFFMEASDYIRHNIIPITFTVVALYFALRLIERRFSHIIIFDQLKNRTPFVGKLFFDNSMAVFCRTSAILISGGIAVPDAVKIAVETFSNRFLHSQIAHMPEAIRQGKLFSQVMEEIPMMPGLLVEMVRVGESSGNLVDVLNEGANFYERSVDNRIATLISLIEPVIIILLGLTIAFMLVSVYLPIFSSIQVAK